MLVSVHTVQQVDFKGRRLGGGKMKPIEMGGQGGPLLGMTINFSGKTDLENM